MAEKSMASIGPAAARASITLPLGHPPASEIEAGVAMSAPGQSDRH
jgi:hypothetical protein